MTSLSERLQSVYERIERAAQRSGRQTYDVTLVAVTKKVSFEKIQPLFSLGVKHIGENRVQEAADKFLEFRTHGPADFQLHMIGPLQTNKAKKAVELFNVIQSLDRWDLAEDLNRHAEVLNKTLECLVQIKISEEATKSGLDPAALPEFLDKLKTLRQLRVKGLMGIPPLAATGDAARPYFQKLRRLLDQSRLEVLSMGMSSDFEVAVEEGSTMVRLGSLLFGPRP